MGKLETNYPGHTFQLVVSVLNCELGRRLLDSSYDFELTIRLRLSVVQYKQIDFG